MIFGDKNAFAIEYDMLFGKEDPEDWGRIYLWVNGRNLFAFENNKPADTYHWYIYMFSRWLCESLENIMNDNDFPMAISAKTTFEYLEKMENTTNELDEGSDEFLEYRSADYEWSEKHCFFISRGGSFAQEMFIRKRMDKLEIIWDSTNIYQNEGVDFLYPTGLEYVSRSNFFNACVKFLQHYCNLPQNANLDSIREMKETLKNTIEKVVV